MTGKRSGLGLLALLLTLAAQADPPPRGKPALTPGNVLSVLGGGSTDALAGTLRGFLLKAMPSPLLEDTHNWGMQTLVSETHWRGKGLHAYRETRAVAKNDGQWWKVRVTAENLADTLIVDLRDVQQPEPGRMTFTTYVSFDTHVDYDRQRWRSGTRTYAGSVRARMRVKLTLRCEATARLEGGMLLPSAVFRLRVLQSDLRYDNFVVEHIPGMGGEAAKLLGSAARGSMRHWKPSLERSLIDRANAAIVQAGDTKEVHLSLSKILGAK
jgi:hypothetical protein